MMEKTIKYVFLKDEVYKIFQDKIGSPISRIRFSSKTGAVICEVGNNEK